MGLANVIRGCACAAVVLALPASAHGAVTIGSSLPASNGDTLACDDPGCTYVPTGLPGATMAAPFDGVVVRWRMRDPVGPGISSARLRVVRPASGGQMSGVAASDHATTTVDGEVTAFETRLSVKRGDHVGIDLSPADEIGLATRAASDAQASFFSPMLANGASDTPVETDSYDDEALFNADIEPDADGDGYGDETQDQCPQLARYRTPCSLDYGVATRSPVIVARPDDELTLSFDLRRPSNTGLTRTHAPLLEVTLTPGLVLRSVQGIPCDHKASIGRCTVPLRRMFSGSNATLTAGFDLSVAAALPVPRTVTIAARVSSSLPDPNPADNNATITVRMDNARCSHRVATTPGDDRLSGTVFGDRIAGGFGADRLRGGAGDDCLSGGDGHDRLSGGAGRDSLAGHAGRDRLSGDSGADSLTGGRGRDALRGGGGPDSLHARDRTRDTVSCGPGADRAYVDALDRVRGCERVSRRKR